MAPLFMLWCVEEQFSHCFGSCFRNTESGASLVAQWLRIRLPMQGTQVRALVWEDPTCHGATKPVRHSYWACALEATSHNYWAHVPQLLKPARLEPVHHSYWACALEAASHNYWAHVPQLLKPARLEPVLRNKRSHCHEKPAYRNGEQPPLAATRESPRPATKTQRSRK